MSDYEKHFKEYNRICIFTLLMCMKNSIYAEPQDEFRFVGNDGKVIYFSNKETKLFNV